MSDNGFDSPKWDELDDSFGMISEDDTADFAGVITLADDAFFDGIDYISPVEQSKLEPKLSATPFPPDPEEEPFAYEAYVANSADDTNPTARTLARSSARAAANQNVGNAPAKPQASGPSHAATPVQPVARHSRLSVKDAYQIPDEDEGSSAGLIAVAIILALAIVGGIVWFIFGAKGCTPSQNEPTIAQDAEDEDTGEEDDNTNTVTPVTPATPVTPVTPTETETEKENENEAEDPTDTETETENTDERESSTTEPETQQPEEQTKEPTQRWVEEQGHWEESSSTKWVVDTEAYTSEETHIEEVLIIPDPIYEPILDEEGNETGEYEEVQPDPYTEQREITETVEHPEVGHWETETTRNWIVDVPGHYETVYE